jgi:xanthine dehydrogenase YagR molybdenum-binding subunit
VPVNADVPDLEAHILEEDDTRAHPPGIQGMGEIGLVGVSTTIGTAIDHATGLWLTTLPCRTDQLLAQAAAHGAR